MERIIIKEKAVNYKVMGLLLFYLFSFLPLSAQTKTSPFMTRRHRHATTS